jgi:hypothetical protein
LWQRERELSSTYPKIPEVLDKKKIFDNKLGLMKFSAKEKSVHIPI